ncbi:MAG: hypothetical protein AAFW46_17615 [Pseudomonadota bacterium]
MRIAEQARAWDLVPGLDALQLSARRQIMLDNQLEKNLRLLRDAQERRLASLEGAVVEMWSGVFRTLFKNYGAFRS